MGFGGVGQDPVQGPKGLPSVASILPWNQAAAAAGKSRQAVQAGQSRQPQRHRPTGCQVLRRVRIRPKRHQLTPQGAVPGQHGRRSVEVLISSAIPLPTSTFRIGVISGR